MDHQGCVRAWREDGRRREGRGRENGEGGKPTSVQRCRMKSFHCKVLTMGMSTDSPWSSRRNAWSCSPTRH
eukprot:1346226-Rhodomonas_salina.1